jgi:hypothetical protein
VNYIFTIALLIFAVGSILHWLTISCVVRLRQDILQLSPGYFEILFRRSCVSILIARSPIRIGILVFAPVPEEVRTVIAPYRLRERFALSMVLLAIVLFFV